MYREYIVILSTLQKCILKDFHPGSTRMKSLMCSSVHWSNMDKDIANAVKSCKGCALTTKAPPIKFNPWPKILDHGLEFTLTLLALWKDITIFTNPSARAGYDTRSNFKWSLTGLNSEFSFS